MKTASRSVFLHRILNPQAAVYLPIGLAFAGVLLSWGWQALSLPGTVAELTPPELLVMLVLSAGMVVGLSRGVPTWSYTWLGLGLASLGVLAGQLNILAFGPPINPATLGGMALPSALSATVWVFLALAASLFLASRGSRHALFFFCLFLGAKVLAFPILLSFKGVSPQTGAMATGALALFAGLEGVALALLLRRFLSNPHMSWSPFWLLLALILVNAPLKFSYLLLQKSREGLNIPLQFGTAVFNSWFYDLAFLLIAFAAVSLYLSLRPKTQEIARRPGSHPRKKVR